LAKNNVSQWYEENKEEFGPPVCNKLMHRDQLTVMFVGGPNTRTDFHIDQGSEFFYQLRGNMFLVIMERGKRRRIDIREGDVFLIPSRVPHSPQRPEKGSLGLVVERRRYDGEVDGLRWFTDFEKCDQILYEKYFQCFDLGRDLVPVVKEYMASDEKATMIPSDKSVLASPPVDVDVHSVIPAPFRLQTWLDEHRAELDRGAVLNLFPGHPDKEILVRVCGGATDTGSRQAPPVWPYETFLFQLKGSIRTLIATTSHVDDIGSHFDKSEWQTLAEGECGVVPATRAFVVERTPGSVGFWITQDPTGNNPGNAARVAKHLQSNQ